MNQTAPRIASRKTIFITCLLALLGVAVSYYFYAKKNTDTVLLTDLKPADLFKAGHAIIDFEKNQLGPLAPGVNINADFARYGLQFDQDLSCDYITASALTLDSRSKGQSGAINKPSFGGPIYIRFHVPGQPMRVAGVRKFGLYIGFVRPNGTTIEIFDRNRNLIGTRSTTKDGETEFIGISCNTPICMIKITPQKNIDPDFAIDDIVFDEPIKTSLF